MKKILFLLASVLMLGTFTACSDDTTTPPVVTETPLALTELYSVYAWETPTTYTMTNNSGAQFAFTLGLCFSDLDPEETSEGLLNVGEFRVNMEGTVLRSGPSISSVALSEEEASYSYEFKGAYTYDETTGKLTYYFLLPSLDDEGIIQATNKHILPKFETLDLSRFTKFEAQLGRNLAGETVLHFDMIKFFNETLGVPEDMRLTTAPTELVLEAVDVRNESK